MATTTTNFGWDIPQSTDLVKDGATAIAALGQDIDTAFVDFKGGTTGQVLKKSSATDLDVEWGTASSGLTLINTTSFSGVASQSVNDVFSATYDNYKIVTSATGSGNNNIEFRLRVSGTDNSATNYRRQRMNANSTTISGQRLTGQTLWSRAGGTTRSGGLIASNILELANPFNNGAASAVSFSGTAPTGNLEYDLYFFGLDVTTSYTGFTLIVDPAGTMTGYVSVYGYSK
jgi:hypothetical protein